MVEYFRLLLLGTWPSSICIRVPGNALGTGGREKRANERASERASSVPAVRCGVSGEVKLHGTDLRRPPTLPTRYIDGSSRFPPAIRDSSVHTYTKPQFQNSASHACIFPPEKNMA